MFSLFSGKIYIGKGLEHLRKLIDELIRGRVRYSIVRNQSSLQPADFNLPMSISIWKYPASLWLEELFRAFQRYVFGDKMDIFEGCSHCLSYQNIKAHLENDIVQLNKNLYKPPLSQWTQTSASSDCDSASWNENEQWNHFIVSNWHHLDFILNFNLIMGIKII